MPLVVPGAFKYCLPREDRCMDMSRKTPEDFPRTAIVTGSDSGIGKATAVALAKLGCDVAITWHTDERGARATADEVRALGRRAEVRQLDLRALPGAAEVIDELADALGGVDVLVNNAGTGSLALLVDLDYSTWRQVIATDLDGAFLCLQRAARQMIAAGRGGRIVNITSVHEHQPRVGAGAYCAAKGGLGLLTKTAALELSEYQITVNAITPGEIATPMTGQEDIDVRQQHRAGVPLAAPGTPGKSLRSLRSCAPPQRRTSPGLPGRWTAGCCRWVRWLVPISERRTGADHDPTATQLTGAIPARWNSCRPKSVEHSRQRRCRRCLRYALGGRRGRCTWRLALHEYAAIAVADGT